MKRKIASRVKELLLDGKQPSEIMNLIPGAYSSFISYHRSKLKLPKFTTGPKWASMKRKQARTLKCEGKTYSKIGKILGVSRQRAARFISDAPKIKSNFCSVCGIAPKIIHYHHLSYKNGKVIPVCISCHSKIHKIIVDWKTNL